MPEDQTPFVHQNAAPQPSTARRVACPVLTCRNDMSADSLMCTACWIALPAYQRVAVDAAKKAVRRQRTMVNKLRFRHAIERAHACAALLRTP